MARLEKLSFDVYNEFDVLISAIEHCRERTGHFSERVLADKIYRNRENLAFSRLYGIRLFDLSLECLRRDAVIDKKMEYADNADRVEVERSFSLPRGVTGSVRL